MLSSHSLFSSFMFKVFIANTRLWANAGLMLATVFDAGQHKTSIGSASRTAGGGGGLY